MQTDTVPYQIDGKAFEGVLVYDNAVNNARCGCAIETNHKSVALPAELYRP